MKLKTGSRLLCGSSLPLSMISSFANHPCVSFVHRFNVPIHRNGKTHPLSTSILSQRAGRSETWLHMSSMRISSSSQRVSPSPWSSGKWKIILDFGRDGSGPSPELNGNGNAQLSNLLGEEWGADGGRLVLSFEMVTNAETDTEEASGSVKTAWLGGKPTGSLECIPRMTNSGEEFWASYINNKGQQNVQMSSGKWRIEPPQPLLPSSKNILQGQAATLRCYFTLLTSIQRNSISLPQNQLLLLQANIFRTQQYSAGIRTLLPYQYAKDKSQKQLEEQLNHETGDRRLDGNDIIETLGGYKDIAELVLERDEKWRKWKMMKGALPKLDTPSDNGRIMQTNKFLNDENRWGIWPGDTQLMTIERGVILTVIEKENKQKRGFFPWMQDDSGLDDPVVVGKWNALPIFDDSYN